MRRKEPMRALKEAPMRALKEVLVDYRAILVSSPCSRATTESSHETRPIRPNHNPLVTDEVY